MHGDPVVTSECSRPFGYSREKLLEAVNRAGTRRKKYRDPDEVWREIADERVTYGPWGKPSALLPRLDEE